MSDPLQTSRYDGYGPDCGIYQQPFLNLVNVVADTAKILNVYPPAQATPKDSLHSAISLNVSLAGMGLMVVSSMEDELLTMTAHDLQLACLLTPRELALDGSIQAVQLDNQSLDALQPVVLGPAGVVTSGAPSCA